MLSGIFYFLSFYFVNELNFDIKTAGIFISCYGLGAIFGGFIGGYLSDAFSSNRVSSLALLVQALSFFLLIKLKTFQFILLNTFLLGCAAYAFITSNYVWILSVCEIEKVSKSKAINLLSVISNLALGLSALLISVYSKHGFNSLFMISGIILLSLSLFLYRQDEKDLCRKSVIQYDPSSSNTDNPAFTKNLYIVLACLFFVGVIISQMGTTYSLYIQSTFPDYGINGFSFLFFLNTSLVVLFQTPLGEFIANRNKFLMISMGSMLLAIGMFVLATANLFFLVIISCATYTLGEMIFFPVSQLACYESAPQQRKGKYLGMYRMCFALSRVAGPLIGGMAYDFFGGVGVWYLCGLIGVFCCIPGIYYRNNI